MSEWELPEVDPATAARVRRAAHAELGWRRADRWSRAHHLWRRHVEPTLVWAASAAYVAWAVAQAL